MAYKKIIAREPSKMLNSLWKCVKLKLIITLPFSENCSTIFQKIENLNNFLSQWGLLDIWKYSIPDLESFLTSEVNLFSTSIASFSFWLSDAKYDNLQCCNTSVACN